MPLIQPEQIIVDRNAGASLREVAAAQRLRRGAIGLGGLVLAYFCWQLAIALLAPQLPYFLSDATPASIAEGKARTMAAAARLALNRGDLWRDQALLLAAPARKAADGDTGARQRLADARGAAMRAVRSAPHDARAWLLLSMLQDEEGADARLKLEALKMSYYTGSSDRALLGWRLRRVLAARAMDDADLRTMAEEDIRVAARDPQFQPLLITAYQTASLAGRRLVEETVSALNPDLLAKMKRSDQPQAIPH